MPSPHQSSAALPPTLSPPTVRGPEAIRLAVRLGFPAVASGVIARRRPIMRLLDRIDADRSTLDTLRQLRKRYGRGPVELDLLGRKLVIVLDPEDVGRVLAESPSPFTPANKEKIGALSPFQPRGVLISRGPIRQRRRDLNEQVLDTDRPLHHLAGRFTDVVAQESADLINRAGSHISAAELTKSWWRIVRRVTLGDRAADDDAITDALWTLRSNGNWTYFHPLRRRVRDDFFTRLYEYAADPESGSLVSTLATVPSEAAVDPVGQIPHWLFAFDAAGIVSLRALALLASHPEELSRARTAVDGSDLDQPQLYPYLRATVLESVRLWPTTPVILRDSTDVTSWDRDGGSFEVASGSAFLILASAFHRDAEVIEYADRFEPDSWLDGRAEQYPQLVPFSGGPAVCPGQNLVLQVTSTLLAQLVGRHSVSLTSESGLTPGRPLPMTLNNFGLEFDVRERSPAASVAG